MEQFQATLADTVRAKDASVQDEFRVDDVRR
jgi:hypothetical protein